MVLVVNIVVVPLPAPTIRPRRSAAPTIRPPSVRGPRDETPVPGGLGFAGARTSIRVRRAGTAYERFPNDGQLPPDPIPFSLARPLFRGDRKWKEGPTAVVLLLHSEICDRGIGRRAHDLMRTMRSWVATSRFLSLDTNYLSIFGFSPQRKNVQVRHTLVQGQLHKNMIMMIEHRDFNCNFQLTSTIFIDIMRLPTTRQSFSNNHASPQRFFPHFSSLAPLSHTTPIRHGQHFEFHDVNANIPLFLSRCTMHTAAPFSPPRKMSCVKTSDHLPVQL